jgi:hypothetical protein
LRSESADFVLTFVAPALAFATDRPGEAISIGLRVLRRTWPRNARYVFVPPLAVAALARIHFPGEPLLLVLVLAAPAALLNLLFKGATARFYLQSGFPQMLLTR